MHTYIHTVYEHEQTNVYIHTTIALTVLHVVCTIWPYKPNLEISGDPQHLGRASHSRAGDSLMSSDMGFEFTV